MTATDSAGDTYVITGFDLLAAQKTGFDGIQLSSAIKIKTGAGANPLTSNTPAPNQASVKQSSTGTTVTGNEQTVTIYASAAQTTSQQVTLNASGASNFSIDTGSGAQSLASGNVTLSIPAGEDHITFNVIDTSTSQSPQTLNLTATLNSDQAQSNSLALNFNGEPAAPNTTDLLAGGAAHSYLIRPNQYYIFTEYNTTGGDHGNAGTYLVSAGTGPNEIDLNNAGNNSVTGGTGNDTINAYGTNNIINGNGGADIIEDNCSPTESSQLYANGVIDVATAIQQASTQTATGNQGSWLADLDGNDTIIGDADSTAISVGTGNNVVVLGAGNANFFGGVDATDIPYNWGVQSNGNFMGPTWSNISVVAPAGYHGATAQVATPDGTGAFYEAGVGNDTIYGGAGTNAINLSNGNNLVQCGGGTTQIALGAGNNTIQGGAGNDTFTGGGGANYIVLGSGTSYLVANGGNDTIQGGSGNATIYSGDNGSGWATSESANTNQIQAGAGTTVIFGSAGNDTLNGGDGSDSIYGGAGNEVINTGDGGTSELPTAVLAGDGDTTVTGGLGVDHIFGGAGNDVLNAGDGGTAANPTYVGAGSGNTTINGGAGVDNLVAGSGSDWINAGSGGYTDATGTYATSVEGGSGDDTVVAGSGIDAFFSGTGATTYQINGDVGIVQINDSTAQDTLSFGPDVTIAGLTVQQGTYTSEDGTTSGTSVVFTLNQGGVVQIFGGELSEATFADGTTIPFSELLSSSFTVNGVTYSSADGTLQQVTTSSAGGGLGSNVANDYEGSVGKPIAAQGSATATPDTSNPATLPTQSLTLTGMADLSATGNNANDILTANGGNDTLIAGSANNTLVGGGASELYIVTAGSATTTTINKSSPNDTLAFNSAINASNLSVSTAAASDGSLVVTLQVAGGGDVVITGSDSANIVDLLEFTDGSSASLGQMLAQLTTGPTAAQSAASITLAEGVQNMALTGSASVLATANVQDDVISANSGNDTLIAGTGSDTLVGSSGATTYVVSAGDGAVNIANSGANDVLQLGAGYTESDVQLSTSTVNGAMVTTIGSTQGGDITIGGSLSQISFADGSTATLAQLLNGSFNEGSTTYSAVSATAGSGITALAMTGNADVTATANAGNDMLVANQGNDTLVAGTGNDTLTGGGVSEDYVIANGSQNTTIKQSSMFDTLTFGTGVTASDLSAVASTASDGSTVITLTNSLGGTVLIDVGAGAPVDEIAFANGSTGSVGDILAQATTGTSATTSAVDVTLPEGIQNMTLTGSANVTATGNELANVITANSGNDTLIAGLADSTLIGGSGVTTYDISAGSNITIENSGANDVLNLDSSIAESDLTTTSSTVNGKTVTTIVDDQGGTITLQGAINTLNFADGGTATIAQLLAPSYTEGTTLYSQVNATATGSIATVALTGDGSVTATGSSTIASTLESNSGNDTLIAGSGGNDTLVGGAGNTTYQITAGSGLTTIDNSWTGDTLDFTDSSINPAAVSAVASLASDGSTTVTISTGGHESVQLLDYQLGSVDAIAFAGNTGTIDSLGALLAQATSGITVATSSTDVTLPEGIQNMTLTASDIAAAGNDYDNVITANAANDTLIAGTANDTLYGGRGTTTYEVGQGSGNVTIGDTGSTDVLAFGAGITAANITVENQTINSNLQTTIVESDGATVTLVNNNLNTVDFADGSTATLSALGNRPISSATNIVMPAGVTQLTLTGTGNISGTGNNLADTITANSGNDTLIAGTGYATLIGGSGNDTFIVNNPNDVVQEPATNSGSLIETNTSYTLPANVINLTATGGNGAVLTGNSLNDSIVGNSGYDTLNAGSGNDTLVAGSGVDVLNAGAGTDLLTAGAGSDTLNGGTGNATLVAGSGNDSLTAGSGAATLESGTGTSTLTGNGTNTQFIINSEAGNVSINNPGGVLKFGANVSENDITNVDPGYGSREIIITFKSGATVTATLSGVGDTNNAFSSYQFADGTSYTLAGLVSAYTHQSIPASSSNLNNELLTGGTANDTLVGGYNDTITGGAGNDYMGVVDAPYPYNGATLGSDTFYFNKGDGQDIVYAPSYSYLDTWYVITSTGGTASGTTVIAAPNTFVFGTGITSANLSISVNINAGRAQSVFLNSSYGDSIQLASTYLYVPFGQSYADSVAYDLFNSPTASTFKFADGTSETWAQFLAGQTINITSAANYQLQELVGDNIPENLTLTGTSDLTATGGLMTSVLTANSGNDTLIAGTGLATLVGGTGNDTFEVTNTNDVIVLQPGVTAGTVITSAQNYTLPGGLQNMIGIGRSSIVMTGNSTADTITDQAAGFDTLIAGSGIATLVGSINGSDTFEINNALDVITIPTNAYDNTVITSVNYTAPTQVTTLTGTGSANLTLTDNAKGASVTGNSGNDLLTANAGNATLTSGSGLDTLVGGGGNDTFTISNASDVITESAATGNNTEQTTFSTTNANNISELILIGTASATLTANSQNVELLSQSTGNATLVAGAGNDTLESSGTGNATTMVGGSGSAEFYGLSAANTYDINMGDGAISITGSQPGDAIVFGSGITASSITGKLTTSNGDVTYTLSVAGGPTVIVDDPNFSNVKFADGTSTTLTALTTVTSITSSTSIVMPAGATKLTLTGTGSISGTGNNLADTIIANSGNDSLIAGSGLATLVGGSGNDTFEVNNTADVIQQATANAADIVQSTANYTLPANLSILTGTGSNAITLTGNNLSNKITANSGNDTLVAGSGVATLTGGAGNDTFVVDNSSDSISVSTAKAGNVVQSSVNYVLPTNLETLTGTGSANLTLTGNASTDKITANSGNDTLTAGSGVATLVGGAGNDVFVVNNASDVITEAANSGNNTEQSSVTVTLAANVQNLTASGTGNISLTGNSINNVITANSGNDTLVAGAGNATLVSGTGNDSMTGGAGNDTFVVNNSSDTITVSSAKAGNVVQSSVSYVLPANLLSLTGTGSGNLSLTGNASADTITANSGNDTLTAGAGLATLIGGTGDDTFVVNSASDVITEAANTGNNTESTNVSITLAANLQNLTATGSAAVTLTGNSGNNVITANSGNDTLVAGSGNDTLSSGTGVVSMTGGAGNDTFIVNNASDKITVSAAKAGNAVQSSVSFTLPANLLNLAGTSTGAINLTGNTLADTITANSGNDTLTSGTGIDTLVGGTGNDTFVVNNSSDAITVSTAKAGNVVQSAVSYVLPANLLSLTGTGSGNINLTGNTLADTITANSGNDTLTSGTGIDTLVGGTGNDTFIINNSSDAITVTTAKAGNVVQSSVSYVLPTNLLNVTGTGTNAISLTGNASADTITANSGNDTLTAGSGLATLIGGAGNDTFVVNNASDVITEAANSGNNTESTSVAVTLATNVQNLTGTGSTAIKLTGNSGTDVITGNSGNDTLAAGSGNDTLIAGTGSTKTTMTGGAGNDTFVINNTGDTITATAGSNVNTIQSSVSFTAPTNVQDLFGTGTGAITLTGNSGNDLLIGNSGNDTLTAGSGVTVIEAGSGTDVLKDTASANALIAGSGNDSLTGGTGVSFLVGGAGNDAITLGAGTSVVAFNTGAGKATIAAGTNTGNVLSLGGGIAYANLSFSKSGNNLILSTGGNNTITFTNWYSATADQDFVTLQVIEQAAATYSSTSTNTLYSSEVESFNFTSLVAAFNAALAATPSLTSWSLSNALLTDHLSSSNTAALGGDLAYYDGLNGNLTGLNLATADTTLQSSSFGKTAQTIDAWSGVSNGTNKVH